MTTHALTMRATITKRHDGCDGYAVSVTLKQNGISRQLVDKVVPSCFAARLSQELRDTEQCALAQGRVDLSIAR